MVGFAVARNKQTHSCEIWYLAECASASEKAPGIGQHTVAAPQHGTSRYNTYIILL